MKIEDILESIGNQKYDNDQLSLPVVINKDGKIVISLFSYKSYDSSEDTTVINFIGKNFVFDVESGLLNIEEVNDETQRTIKYENLYSLDELDALYEEYYGAINKNLTGELDTEELNTVLNKLMPTEMVNIYAEVNARKNTEETITEAAEEVETAEEVQEKTELEEVKHERVREQEK